MLGDEEDEMNSLEALTSDILLDGSEADGAARDHHGDDEQRDLEEQGRLQKFGAPVRTTK
jgi:hypothetical protein